MIVLYIHKRWQSEPVKRSKHYNISRLGRCHQECEPHVFADASSTYLGNPAHIGSLETYLCFLLGSIDLETTHETGKGSFRAKIKAKVRLIALCICSDVAIWLSDSGQIDDHRGILRALFSDHLLLRLIGTTGYCFAFARPILNSYNRRSFEFTCCRQVQSRAADFHTQSHAKHATSGNLIFLQIQRL